MRKPKCCSASDDAVVVALRDQAALDLLEHQRLDLLRQAQRHRAQRQVDRAALRLALGQLDPGAQRAVALAQLERQVDVAAQLVHVDARQVDEGVAAPALPVAGARQQRLGEAAAQR